MLLEILFALDSRACHSRFPLLICATLARFEFDFIVMRTSSIHGDFQVHVWDITGTGTGNRKRERKHKVGIKNSKRKPSNLFVDAPSKKCVASDTSETNLPYAALQYMPGTRYKNISDIVSQWTTTRELT